LDIITLTAFSLSIASIVIVIVSLVVLRRQVTSQYHVNSDNGLEVSAIVSEFSQRMKKLEENLIDQKVKLEILELRVQRSSGASVSTSSGVTRSHESFEPRRENEIHVEPQSLSRSEEMPIRIEQTEQRVDVDKRAGSTEREALRLVFEGRGKTTAKDIQQKIGRTREHAARMMNGLFQEGLVDRDVSVRPFAYSITQKGRDLLNS
jgi:CRP-like cAMP-binding protein